MIEKHIGNADLQALCMTAPTTSSARESQPSMAPGAAGDLGGLQHLGLPGPSRDH